MNQHIFLEPTESGITLELTFEQEHNCKVVYKETEDGQGYAFCGLWDNRPEAEYSDEHIIVPLRSVYDCDIPYTSRDIFANIIDSDPDHCPASSWLQLFRDHNIPCTTCVTDGTFYDSRDQTGRTYFTGLSCGGGMVGGHVINSFNAASVAQGSYVLLLPICKHHNSYCTDNTGRNGSGFFMMPRQRGYAIQLRGYLQKNP